MADTYWQLPPAQRLETLKTDIAYSFLKLWGVSTIMIMWMILLLVPLMLTVVGCLGFS